MSSSVGTGLGEGEPTGEGGDEDLGGVEGGEGNRVGWMGEGGEEASCLAGEERGRKTVGLMGEACFVGEEDWGVTSLVGDDGEGQETGVEGVVQLKGPVGPEGKGASRDPQGEAEGDVGDVRISGGNAIGKEAMGKDSAEGEGEN